MVSRTTLAIAGLVGSLAVSVALYLLTDSVLVFLVVPFVPVLLGRGGSTTGRRCPACGFETTDDDVRYCPRDGSKLE